MKPTRENFCASVKQRFPGALCVRADRGLLVAVGSADVAMTVEASAKEAGLTPIAIEREGAESYIVRIFGFPRHRRAV